MTIREDMLEQEMLEKNKCFVCHRICNENGDCEVCNDPETYANTPIEMERRAFEAWQCTQNNSDRLNFHYSSNAESGIKYEDISIDYAWQSWLAAKQHTTQQSGWISVADRLPENNDRVLVMLSGNYLENGTWVGFYDPEYLKHYPILKNINTNWYVYGWNKNPFDVTHWQPLPPPTK